jgi:hypothetical protein
MDGSKIVGLYIQTQMASQRKIIVLFCINNRYIYVFLQKSCGGRYLTFPSPFAGSHGISSSNSDQSFISKYDSARGHKYRIKPIKNKKLKFPLCLTTHYAMKTYGGVEV